MSRIHLLSSKSTPRTSAHLIAASVLTIAAIGILSTAQAQLPASQTSQGIEYVTGGAGKDESDAFKEAKSRYPLALTFAATSPGSSATPYVAQVKVDIKDESGETVLSIPSAGPYVLANLDAGRYTISASYDGETQTREVTVSDNGTADLRFAWERPATGSD